MTDPDQLLIQRLQRRQRRQPFEYVADPDCASAAQRIQELKLELAQHRAGVDQAYRRWGAAQALLARATAEMRWALPVLERHLTHPNDTVWVDDFRSVLAELEDDQ